MGLSLGVVGGLVAFVGVLCLWVGWVCGCLGAYLFTHTYRGADQVFYAHLGLPSLYSLLVYFLVYIKQMEAGPTNNKSRKYQAETKINTVQKSRNAIREPSPKQINQPQMRWGLAPAGS